MFGIILVSITTLMQIYVFWRIASVPIITEHVSTKVIIYAGIVLWVILFSGLVLWHDGEGFILGTLEFLAMNWMATVFLVFISLLLIDIVTVWGLILSKFAPAMRGWALIVGVTLSLIALVQGMRPPVINEYEVNLPGLPDTMNNTVIIALSDMHLGSLLGKSWLSARIAQVNEQNPDIIVLLGDIFEGHGPPEDEFVDLFNQLDAPLGIWAVPGNHEYHGRDKTGLLEKCGFKLLSNKWTEVKPGFILSGVNDLSSWHRNGRKGDPISEATAGRPAGATIFLSHTPWEAQRISQAGVGLMLSGHTHGGQIWPFDYFVQPLYPLFEGRYEVNRMTVIVSRGTGTWGPRMRLWHPGEILRVTLNGKGSLN